MSAPYVRQVEDGIELDVRVQPRASRNKLTGTHDGALKVALTAPPVDGEANEALVVFIAERLGVSRRQVELVAGHSSRRKRLRVRGLSADALEAVIK
jgi:uncharacterized protein (TIGR00251 family)